jgi:hypothetical protein
MREMRRTPARGERDHAGKTTESHRRIRRASCPDAAHRGGHLAASSRRFPSILPSSRSRNTRKASTGSAPAASSRSEKSSRSPRPTFSKGAPGGWQPAGTGDDRTTNTFVDFLGTRDGQSLAGAFSKIPDTKLPRSVVDLVERVAAISNRSPATSRRGKKA